MLFLHSTPKIDLTRPVDILSRGISLTLVAAYLGSLGVWVEAVASKLEPHISKKVVVPRIRDS